MLQQTSLRARATATVVTMSTDPSMSSHPRDVAQLAERRQALDGYAYTAIEFQQHYGGHWQTFWNAATPHQVADPGYALREAQPRVVEGSVPQAASALWLGQQEAQPQVVEGSVPQPAAAIGAVEQEAQPQVVEGSVPQPAAAIGVGEVRLDSAMECDAYNTVESVPNASNASSKTLRAYTSGLRQTNLVLPLENLTFGSVNNRYI